MNDDPSASRWPKLPLLLTVVVLLAMVVQAVAPPPALGKPKPGSDKASQRVAAQHRERGEARDRQPRGVQAEIVGGKSVDQGRLAFMTVVFVDLHDGTFVQCGGSMIDASYVLTAAHCVEDDDGRLFPAADFIVLVGKAKISDAGGANTRGVTAVFQDPDWDPVTFENDAAVLRLDEPVPASLVTPLELVGSGETEFDKPGRNVVVAGWGRLSEAENAPSPNQLRQAALKVVSSSGCADDYQMDFLPPSMICASAKGKDACFGDSGGPLIAHERIGSKKVKKKGKRHKVRVPITRDVQIGIVSWGQGCAEKGFPGVYTRLSDPDVNDFVTSHLSG